MISALTRNEFLSSVVCYLSVLTLINVIRSHSAKHSIIIRPPRELARNFTAAAILYA